MSKIDLTWKKIIHFQFKINQHMKQRLQQVLTLHLILPCLSFSPSFPTLLSPPHKQCKGKGSWGFSRSFTAMPYCSSHSLPYSGEGSFYGLKSFKYCSTVGLRPAGCNWGHSHGLFHGLQGTSVPHLEHSCLPALTLRSAGLLLLCFPHTVVLHSFFSLL